jgi:hypothetical protein
MYLFFCGYKASPQQGQPVYTKGVKIDTILRRLPPKPGGGRFQIHCHNNRFLSLNKKE